MAEARKTGGQNSRNSSGRGNDRRNNAQQRKRPTATANKNQVVFFDYRDERKLKRFINEQGKIIPRRITGLTAKEQRMLTQSIKWARHLAIIPFVSDQIK